MVEDEGIMVFVTITTVLPPRGVLFQTPITENTSMEDRNVFAPFISINQKLQLNSQLSFPVNCISPSTRSFMPLLLPFPDTQFVPQKYPCIFRVLQAVAQIPLTRQPGPLTNSLSHSFSFLPSSLSPSQSGSS